ncbi:hypothetical protein HWV01_03250 [Moritella sp. 5]|uniref:hypothetical protein n=1 Tax=Moritella sp. 5 TaxID=2746231 RepID=UPI001BA8F2FB|nr:hypothetical protein [Moritella sp. 5]QUM79390.1 hypothetical protein HWV01_03250 [Moritella sp. 5]
MGNIRLHQFVGCLCQRKTDKFSYPFHKINIYMGYWFFKSQLFYNKLIGLESPYNSVSYVFDDFIKTFRVAIYKLGGFVVAVDWFPDTDGNIIKSGPLVLLIKLSFQCIKKLNVIILLFSSLEEVSSKKQRLSIEKVDNIQKAIINLAGANLMVINSDA